MRLLGKRWIALTLAVLLTVGIFAYVMGGINAPSAANRYRTTLAHGGEALWRGLSGIVQRSTNYTGYTPLADIPETENGYVPQGYCYCEAADAYIISYYHDKDASVLSMVDAKTGKRQKTVLLHQSDGTPFTGHAGGVADDDTYIYICDDNTIYRISLERLQTASDGAPVMLTESIVTDVKCSYIGTDGEYLYAGEFYTYYSDGRYDTDPTHHMQVSTTELSFARCNAYALSEIENAFAETPETTVTPTMSFTVPNRVQGFTRLSDGQFALSVSYGRNTDSWLYTYADVTKGEPAYYLTYPDRDVPVYSLCRTDIVSRLRLPPLLEGIDTKDGKVTGIFESGAEKYKNGKFILNSICEFE